MPWREFVAFLLSSIIATTLGAGKAPVTIFEAVITILIVLLVFFDKGFNFSSKYVKYKLTKWVRLFALFLSALLVQLIIVSTGGFYSPFLILLHFYTLGSSFLLKISSAFIFLMLSLIVLISTTILNPTLMSLFQQDPGPAILYFVSFIVIIPLAQFLMSTYHLKDTISKILTENLAIGEKREQSILSGLNEMVVVTDKDLKILSFNEAVERLLDLQGIILGENFLIALHLKDQTGSAATLHSLSINQALQNRVTYFVKGFELETKYDKHFKVSIKVNPITNLAGEVNQISFVMTDAKLVDPSAHATLEESKQRQKSILDNLKTSLEGAHLPSVETGVIFLGKMEEDLLIAQDLEDHTFKKSINYQDLAELMLEIIVKKEPLSKALQVNLQFNLSKDEVEEAAYLSLKKSNPPPEALSPSEFSVPTDAKWLNVLLERLVDISILLSFGNPNAAVNLYLDRTDEKTRRISVITSPVQLKESEKEYLFEKYYGNLASTNLRFGSGLEGFIAKAVSSELKLPIDIQINTNTIIMSLKVSKDLH